MNAPLRIGPSTRRGAIGAAAAAGGAVAVIAAICVARQAEGLSASLSKTLLDQILVATGDGRLTPAPDGLLPISLRFIWVAPLTGLLAQSFHALTPLVGAPAAIALGRVAQFLLFEAGAPVLAAVALRRGLRPQVAAALGVLYAFSPFALNKLAWDLVVPGAPFVVLAELARLRGARAACATSIAAAAWCHPFAGVGPTLWTLLRARAAPTPGERRAELGVAAAGALAVAVSWSGLLYPVLFHPDQVWFGFALDSVRSFSALARAGRYGELAGAVALNALDIATLLAAAGGLLLRRPLLLAPLALDLVYGLLTPQGIHDHGLVPSTVGMLFVLTIDAIVQGPPLGPRGLRPHLAVAGLASAVLLWAAPQGVLRSLRGTTPPPGARALRAAVALAPELRDRRCVVSPSLAPFFAGRCAETVAYASPGGVADPSGASTIVALAPARILPRHVVWDPARRDVLEWERSPQALGRIAALARRGALRVAQRSSDLILLAPDGRIPVDGSLLAKLEELARSDPADDQSALQRGRSAPGR